MKRRSFFASAAAAAAGCLAWRAGGAQEKPAPAPAPAPAPDPSSDAIDPYFLDPGFPPADERRAIEAFVDYQGRAMEGKPALLPRGGRPKRAPNFRFLHWTGELGSGEGRLVGPLGVQPAFDAPPPYQLNAQILGFHASSEDWSGSSGKGTLTIEFRARQGAEALTWLFMQQFEVQRDVGTTIGLEYVAQRDGKAVPVVSDDPNVDLRIQLMRYKTAPQLFRKILKVGASLAGLPIGGSSAPPSAMGAMGGMGSAPALLRVPRLAQEGVAFAQATVGGMADEAPVWRGAFTSYGIASGGSRLALKPGFWVAIDDAEGVDYAKLRLEDVGGRIGVLGPDGPLDLNYLVLSVEVRPQAAPRGELTPKGV